MSETQRIELAIPDGLHPRLALLYAQLEDVRNNLKGYARDWTRKQLEQEPIEGFPSPGGVLVHIAEAEAWWVQVVLQEAGDPDDPQSLPAGWCKPFEEEDNEPVARDQAPETYLFLLDRIRRQTHELLAQLGPDDFDRAFHYSGKDGKEYSFGLEWVLHHLVEHEAHHRGQFALMKRLLSP